MPEYLIAWLIEMQADTLEQAVIDADEIRLDNDGADSYTVMELGSSAHCAVSSVMGLHIESGGITNINVSEAFHKLYEPEAFEFPVEETL